MLKPIPIRNFKALNGRFIEDITRWREDMNFMFEWQEQYLTSERSERVRYCSCHENLKSISSSHLVMFFFYMETKQRRCEKPIPQKQKAGIVTSLNDVAKVKPEREDVSKHAKDLL